MHDRVSHYRVLHALGKGGMGAPMAVHEAKELELVERRRRFLLQFGGLGLSSTLLPGVLWAKVQEGQAQKITKAMLRDAEQIAGVQFDDAERELILNRVNENVERYDALRTVALPNHVPSALRFSPILPGMTFERTRKPLRISVGFRPCEGHSLSRMSPSGRSHT
jgi:hypothetical protein